MNKIKLAICMGDLEYQTRFVNCFMNHYNHQYELHVFTLWEQLEMTRPKEYAVIITGEYNTKEMTKFVERGEILLNLTDSLGETKETFEETIVFAEKYQEVYKIAEIIERLVADKVETATFFRKDGPECIGVYSLTRECFQTPFAALLGKLYGEQQKVLVLDLQPYSGFGQLEEGTKELYLSMMEFLVQELGYEKIILNFGTIFLGQLELMTQCETLYLLCEKEEENFFQELMRQEKEQLIKQVRKIELPRMTNNEKGWRNLAEKWNWSHIGEQVRQEMQREKMYGAVV